MQRGVGVATLVTLLVFCVVGAMEQELNPASWSVGARVAFAVGVFGAACVGMQYAIDICDFKRNDNGKRI